MIDVQLPRSEQDDDRLALLQLLSTLVRVPSVVGAEAAFMRALERELVLYGAHVRVYQGLLEATGDTPDSCLLSVHLDRHGIMCTGPGEYQYAAYVARAQGDLDGNSVSEQTVSTISDRFGGAVVESYDPWHGGYLGQGVVRSTRYDETVRNLLFELDGIPSLRAGTPLAYLQPVVFGEDTVSAQLDNVLCVALAVDMFRRGFRGTVLFTAEEEAGRSWRYILQWFRRRNLAYKRLIVLDTSPYPDDETVRRQDLVLRRRDANGAFNAELVDELAELCAGLGARVAFKDEQIEAINTERAGRGEPARSLGRTELGRLVTASEGEITGATLQLPTIGYHTPQETVTYGSIDAALAVTGALIAG